MIRILLADDENLVRQGLRALLEPNQKFEIVGTAINGNDALEQVKTFEPDIVLIDIEMPGISGIIATKKIIQEFPETKVIVLSSHENQEYIIQAFEAGAKGYLVKATLFEDLEQAIWSVYQGKLQLDSKLLEKVASRISSLHLVTSEANDNFYPQKKPLAKILPRLDECSKSDRIEESLYDNSDSSTNTFNKQKAYEITIEKAEPFYSKNSRNLLWLSVGLFLLILGVILTRMQVFSAFIEVGQKKVSSPAISVPTAKVRSIGNHSTLRTYSGELVAWRSSKLGFERSGKAISIDADEGDRVTKGTILATLDTRNIEVQIKEAIAGRNEAIAQLQELENGPREEEIIAARAEVEQQEEELSLAKIRQTRRQKLFTEKAISREQMDEAVLNTKVLAKNLAASQSHLDKLMAGYRIEKIDAQKAKVEQLDAKIDNLKVELDESKLVAPFNGIISARYVDEGTIVSQGQSVLQIVEVDNLKARIGVPVTTSQRLQIGSNYPIKVEGKTHLSRLKSLRPAIDPDSLTVTAIFELENQAFFKIGQIARLHLKERRFDSGYWLPNTSLISGSRGLWSVYALSENKVQETEKKNDFVPLYQVESRDVEIIYTEGNRVLVKGSIEEGELVIVNGVHRVVPGQLVNSTSNQ